MDLYLLIPTLANIYSYMQVVSCFVFITLAIMAIPYFSPVKKVSKGVQTPSFVKIQTDTYPPTYRHSDAVVNTDITFCNYRNIYYKSDILPLQSLASEFLNDFVCERQTTFRSFPDQGLPRP